MSLKAFHIVFIVLSVSLSCWFGWWATGSGEASAVVRTLGFVSYACAVGLLVYGVAFFKKLTQLKTTP